MTYNGSEDDVSHGENGVIVLGGGAYCIGSRYNGGFLFFNQLFFPFFFNFTRIDPCFELEKNFFHIKANMSFYIYLNQYSNDFLVENYCYHNVLQHIYIYIFCL